MAPSHGGIQQTAPGTKHHPASPQRRSMLKRGALQSFTRHSPPTPWETECLPIPLVWELSIDQPISSATGSLVPSTPTYSVLAGSSPLLLLCQLTCPPPSLGLHPHRCQGLSPHPFLVPCPPPPGDPPAVYLPTPVPFPLQEWPSQFLECLVEKSSQTQFSFQDFPHWQNMGSGYHNATHQMCIMRLSLL